MSHASDFSSNVLGVFSSGSVDDFGAGYSDVVWPVFYLESDVTFFGGNGTKNNPYKILSNNEDVGNKDDVDTGHNDSKPNTDENIDKNNNSANEEENPNTGAFINCILLSILLLISFVVLVINRHKKILNKI